MHALLGHMLIGSSSSSDLLDELACIGSIRIARDDEVRLAQASGAGSREQALRLAEWQTRYADLSAMGTVRAHIQAMRKDVPLVACLALK